MPNPPKPTALRLLHGNPGKRAIKQEPRYRGAPKCPTWLSAAAKREWRRVAGLLAPHGVLKATDEAILTAYAVAFANWQEAQRTVQSEGLTYREPVLSRSNLDTGRYRIKSHPAVVIAQREREALRHLAAVLGLDPSNRARIAVGAPDPYASTASDEDEEFGVIMPKGAA